MRNLLKQLRKPQTNVPCEFNSKSLLTQSWSTSTLYILKHENVVRLKHSSKNHMYVYYTSTICDIYTCMCILYMNDINMYYLCSANIYVLHMYYVCNT